MQNRGAPHNDSRGEARSVADGAAPAPRLGSRRSAARADDERRNDVGGRRARDGDRMGEPDVTRCRTAPVREAGPRSGRTAASRCPSSGARRYAPGSAAVSTAAAVHDGTPPVRDSWSRDRRPSGGARRVVAVGGYRAQRVHRSAAIMLFGAPLTWFPRRSRSASAARCVRCRTLPRGRARSCSPASDGRSARCSPSCW